MSGELHVSLETDTVTATTYFKDLKINQFQDTSMVQDDQQSQDTLTLHEARVDVRKLSQFLQGQFIPTKVICSKLLYCCTYYWTSLYFSLITADDLCIPHKLFLNSYQPNLETRGATGQDGKV